VNLGAALVDGPPGRHLVGEDVHVVVEGVEVREGRLVGELDGLVDRRDGLLVQLLDLVLLKDVLVPEAPGEGLDRVALPPLLDLLLGAVFLRIGHRVPAVAVRHGLD
jgi:hypothetical protein